MSELEELREEEFEEEAYIERVLEAERIRDGLREDGEAV